MKYLLQAVVLLFSYSILSIPIRDIFQYDPEWRHSDYHVVAYGHDHLGNSFTIIQCGEDTKVIKK